MGPVVNDCETDRLKEEINRLKKCTLDLLSLSPNEVKRALKASEKEFDALRKQAEFNQHSSDSTLKKIHHLREYLSEAQQSLHRIECLHALSKRDDQSNMAAL